MIMVRAASSLASAGILLQALLLLAKQADAFSFSAAPCSSSYHPARSCRGPATLRHRSRRRTYMAAGEGKEGRGEARRQRQQEQQEEDQYQGRVQAPNEEERETSTLTTQRASFDDGFQFNEFDERAKKALVDFGESIYDQKAQLAIRELRENLNLALGTEFIKEIGEDAINLSQELTHSRRPKADEESFTIETTRYTVSYKGRNSWAAPGRFILYGFLALMVALGGNLFGVTSSVLSMTPETRELGRSAQLDVLYPIDGYKRHVDRTDGYTFMFPKDWLGDQALQLGRAPSADSVSPTDVAKQRKLKVRPSAAYGPPGGNYRENVSVIKTKVMQGFSLRGTLGDPTKAAEILLSTAIAPPGSGKEWNLINAFEEEREGGLVYQFEYTIKTDRNVFLHNVGVIASKDDDILTLTTLCPERFWPGPKEQALSTIAKSFHLLP